MISLRERWRRSPLLQRLIGGTGANALGKVWILVVQFALLSVLTRAWGVDGYGRWLMITTIPAYIGLADFGVGSAVTVEMTRHVARGDYLAAARAFQSVRKFLTILLSVLGGFALLGVLLWQRIVPDQGELQAAAACMVLCAVLSLLTYVERAVFTATHRYASGTVLFDLLVPIEGAIVGGAALAGWGVLAAAIGMVLIRIVWFLIFVAITRRIAPWIGRIWHYADLQTIRALMRPSLAMLALTLSNAICFQGMILSIGWSMSPADAALFGTIRMLSRAPLQFSALLARASQPELTRSMEAQDLVMTRRLISLNLGTTLAIMLPFSLVIGIWGSKLLDLISHGQMSAPSAWLVLMTCASLCTAIWTVLSVQLLAANRQGDFAWIMLLIYALQMLVPTLVPTWRTAPYAASLIGEALVLAAVVVAIRRGTQDCSTQ